MTRIISRITAALTLLVGLSCLGTASAQTPTTLADQPVFANADVPGNLAFDLSVEFPTAISVANLGNYSDASTYLGYFDPGKCYNYVFNSTTPAASYFQPATLATGTNGHSCSGMWSGNFMNWAAMPTIDPFRWALTGGYRSVDTTTTTILEKAWGSAQGSVGENYPYRGTSQGGGENMSTSLISSLTPFSAWPQFNSAIWGNGNMMVFSSTGNYGLGATSSSVYDLSNLGVANTSLGSLAPWRVYIRIKVCDATTSLGTALLESNCVQYPPNGTSPMPSVLNYKPEGLMQQYSNKIRFAAISYLNQDGYDRQGGVLREPMGFIGPTYPQPLSTTVITNSRPEWDAVTGIQSTNPDPTTASASGVSQSGVMNYLNKFGEYGKSYKTYDNVSELYYAAVRYYENLGNVPEWTNGANATALDGFPAVTTWVDPIAYSCQKNFILGIGDDHTWYDYNVGGDTNDLGPRAMPASVTSDTFNKASTWTSELQTLEGITVTPVWPFDTGATYFIAGLAYGVHVNDIRPDPTGTTMPGAQTISTYWMDVAEDQEVENLNPFYLATKYGGFSTPTINADPGGPDYVMTTPLTTGQWNTTGNSITMNGGHVHGLPDNYFVANNANAMVTSLTSAFQSIATAVKAFTTSFSFSAPNVTSTGTESFATQYDSTGWTGTITASTLTFDASGNPTGTALWSTDTTYQTQLAGSGWNTGRNIATWNGTAGVPFEAANLTAAQRTDLSPAYSSSLVCSSSSCPYLNYIRGDQTNEVGSTAPGSTQSLRARTLLLGDIVDAGLVPVAAPIQTFSEANNPGYAAFKSTWAGRPTVVYAGANDGMMHAFLGSTGVEQFAYVPSGVYGGPDNTPQTEGLAELGNPNYSHHFYVDATPGVFDMDFNHTYGSTITTPNWHTVLVGGLGKGGKSFFAIDITNPTAMTTESSVASNVLWEFTDSTMGYSYGLPVFVKTVKYGWVVILTSGYDNADGYGYIYFVNPATGALLEKVRTPSASIGLTQAAAYVKDYSDETADSVYVGDLGGQIWRFDLTGTTGSYPQPTLLAKLTDASNNPQPVTTAPEIEIHPVTRKRYVMVGTGKLLASGDVISTQMQDFYSITDGTATAFLPPTTPITRSMLLQVLATNLTSINSVPATDKGWYTDLGIDSTSGIGWRIVIDPVAYNGIIALTTLLTTGNACSPGGQSRVYALDYSTATSVLNPTSLPYVSYSNSVIDVRFAGANGNPEIIVGFSAGNPPYAHVPAILTGTLATRILNWREVPTVE